MLKRNLYKITTAICALLLLAATIFVWIRWPQIPDQIAIHFNIAGEADAYGGKGSLIMMMAFAWIALIATSLASKFPDKWNFPVQVTEENRSRLYAIGRAMVEVLKVLVSVLFALLMVTSAAAVPMPEWIMMILFVGVIVTVIMGMILMFKNK